MVESTVRDLFRSLEQTIHERFRVIEDVLVHTRTHSEPRPLTLEEEGPAILATIVPRIVVSIEELKSQVATLSARIAAVEAARNNRDTRDSQELLPTHPMQGIEVVKTNPIAELVPAKVVQVNLPIVPSDDSDSEINEGIGQVEEAEEAVEEAEEEVVEEAEEEVVEEAEEEVVEEAEEEVVEEAEEAEEVVEEAEEEVVEEAEEAEGVELEEFEYKGNTYYRDDSNNVYMANDEGEIDTEAPIGIWNALKQRILPKAK